MGRKPLQPGCATNCNLKILSVLEKLKQLVFDKNVFTYCFMSLSLTKYR